MKTIKTTLLLAIITFVIMGIFSCKKSSDTAPVVKTRPTITTFAVTNITANSAVWSANISDSGAYIVTGRGFYWSAVSTNPGIDAPYDQTNDGIPYASFFGNYSRTMTGLTPNTTYYLRAQVGWQIGNTYGTVLANLVSFKTLP